MVRISKDPETRKQEIIDTALTLFLEKGFSKTAVSDIVRKINVAQGTFYYHFSSKQEVLDAAVKQQIAPLVSMLVSIADDNVIDPGTKIRRFLGTLFHAMSANRKLVKHLNLPQNDVMHAIFGEILTSQLLPILRQIVDEGCNTQYFSLDLPEETTEILLGTLTHLTQLHISQIDNEHLERLYSATENLYLRTLGSELGMK